MLRNSIMSIFAGALSLLLFLIFAEVMLRFIAPVSLNPFFVHNTNEWPKEIDPLEYIVSDSFGYEMAANSVSGTNSFGMMDKERNIEKASGIYRIICVGDSTTANSQYPRDLEGMLNRRNKAFEVWNCGVPGYGIFQYLRTIEHKWLNYKPDMIIIGFCLNDFDSTPLVLREGNKLVGYFPRAEIIKKINPVLFRHSAIYRNIILLALSKEGGSSIGDEAFSFLSQIKKKTDAKEIRLLVVLLGLPEKIKDYPAGYAYSYKRIKDMVRKLKIDCVDTVPAFENNDPQDLKLLPGDMVHFNKNGNAIICSEIYRYLGEEGINARE